MGVAVVIFWVHEYIGAALSFRVAMKSVLKSIINYIVIPVVSVLLFLGNYNTVSETVNGVGYGALSHIKLELVFAFIVYYALFFAIKDNWKRYIFSILPIILFYGFYDYYFISFGKIFKFCDASELPELFDVLPLWQIVVYLSVLILPLFIIVANFSNRKQRWLAPLATTGLILLFTTFKPDWYLSLFDAVSSFGITQWSDQNTAQNGYFSSTVYFEAKMASDKRTAYALYGDGSAYEKTRDEIAQFLAGKGNTHNIHIIVLEGFINPKWLSKVNFSSPIFDKQFADLINNKESALISPVFGGYTAQAEFEVLCGVPALHKYSSIEFNSFTSNPTFCLPGILQQTGYRAVVSNGYKPNFFNEANAYEGVGFGEVYFPRQYAPSRNTYLSLVDSTQYIFDGDLFNQNIEFVKKHLSEKNNKPILNYVLGVYGHLPFKLDEKRHPLLIKATLNNRKISDELDRVSNQIHYRSQALAIYLKELIEIDPHSLIIVTGDHLPRLGGTEFYKNLNWRNNIEDAIHQPSSFFIVDGNVVQKNTMHQYEVINLIFDRLTDDLHRHPS